MNIMLVNSYVGCGKDTFGEALKSGLREYRKQSQLVALAEPGYRIAKEFFNSSDREYVKGVLESLRLVDENVWVNYVLDKKINSDIINIVTDVRQVNELCTLQNHFFIPIVLEISLDKSIELQKMRKEAYGKEVVTDEEFLNLDSEIGAFKNLSLTGEAIFIKNDSSLKELEKKAKSIAEAIYLYDLLCSLSVVTHSVNSYETNFYLEELCRLTNKRVEISNSLYIMKG